MESVSLKDGEIASGRPEMSPLGISELIIVLEGENHQFQMLNDHPLKTRRR